MFLCKKDDISQICTIACPLRSDCFKDKTALMVWTMDIKCTHTSGPKIDSLTSSAYVSENLQGEGYVNDIVISIDEPTDICLMSCSNPQCDNLLRVTRKQKHFLLTTSFLRFKRFRPIYCSKTCQDNHMMELGVNHVK